MDQQSETDFQLFVAENRRLLLRTARMLTADPYAAEDLLQSALTKTYRGWTTLRQPELAAAYVRRAMYHEQVDRWRRADRETCTELVPEVLVGRDGGDLAPTLRLGLRLAIQDALATLSPGQRAVIVLRYLADMSESDVAERLGCSVGTVKSQTHRAVERLRATGLADVVVGGAVSGW